MRILQRAAKQFQWHCMSRPNPWPHISGRTHHRLSHRRRKQPYRTWRRLADDFDNAYYTDLVGNRGLLQSDQELFSTEGAETIAAVNRFATNRSDFFAQFGESMIKMGKLEPLIAPAGEIRLNCRCVFSISMVSLWYSRN